MAIDDAHPIIGAITQWNPATMIQRELREREDLGLPPFEKVHTSVFQAMKQLNLYLVFEVPLPPSD